MTIKETYTSTGAKFFHHQETMNNLRAGKGQPITTHVMLTDVCNHTCAFCSVQARTGDALPFSTVKSYLQTLIGLGLKSVILSGGGNPILYKCKNSGADFNNVVDWIHGRGLEIGLITNGMPLKMYIVQQGNEKTGDWHIERLSWKAVRPETLDKLTWVRISMSGLDHPEGEVYVPAIDTSKTTLGFSYVAHDIYREPADPYHGKVSTQLDVITNKGRAPDWIFEDRIEELTEQIRYYVDTYKPKYVRLLPNCLEPDLIAHRCLDLQKMADDIDPEVVFVQYKPPAAPKACHLGYIHPVLNCDGWVYPCDSCVLNETAGHKFADLWRICRWNEIGDVYSAPVESLIEDPAKTCPGCVFTKSNEILGSVVDGSADLTPLPVAPEHVNFV